MYRIFPLIFMAVFLSACVGAGTTTASFPKPMPTFSPSPTITKRATSTLTSTPFLPSFTPSQEPQATEQIVTTQASTLEEAANVGTHSYYFETEFECATIDSGIFEKFTITIFERSVELKRIEPDPPWNQYYAKVSNNTYAANVESDTGELVQITVEFNKDGFTMLSSAQRRTCGRYIRTLAP